MMLYQVEKGKVILLGDGDFSFGLAFKNRVSSQVNITTSTIHNEDSLHKHHVAASENVTVLKNLGVEVLYMVDATTLENNEQLTDRKFHRIIFNFPHTGGKCNIKKNRELLRNFFYSVGHILEEGGDVCVSLCRGQGGTPADRPVRAWSDSWQVVAMAAYSNFTLRHIWPFTSADYPAYRSTGFRSMDKHFNTGEALTYVFKMSPSLVVPKPCENTLSVAEFDGQEYLLKKHVMKKMNNKLHKQLNNPVGLVYQQIVEQLQKQWPGVELKEVSDRNIAVQNPVVNTGSRYKLQSSSEKGNGDVSSVRSTSEKKEGAHVSKSECKADDEELCSGSVKPLSYLRSSILESLSPADVETSNTGESSVPFVMAGEVYKRSQNINNSDQCVQYELVAMLTSEETEYNEKLKLFLGGFLDDLFGGNVKSIFQPLRHEHDGFANGFCKFEQIFGIEISYRGTNSQHIVPCNQTEALGQRSIQNQEAKCQNISKEIGFFSKLKPGRGIPDNAYVIVFRIDAIALIRYDIPDSRLIWCRDLDFFNQFASLSPCSQHIYKPISMYPPLWRHDISFWESDTEPFNELDLLDIFRDLSDDSIREVILMNVWKDPHTGRTSRCYREVFQSPDHALSHSLAHDFQNTIRLAVAKEMKVELR